MSNLLLALEITALGMGLVFVAFIVLWLMMILLTSITADKCSASTLTESDPLMDSDLNAEVAAIAVAMALAEQELSSAHPLTAPPTAIVSAWQLGMRTRQLYQKGMPVARKSRKAG